MPIKLIGKKSPYCGYLLFEILNKLKNYGLGRVVVRNTFVKKYPEMCFFIIRKVIPMRETIGPGPDELVYGKVWVDEVFRGRKLEGLRLIQDLSYYADYHLIPKAEEDKYLNYESKDIIKIIPKYVAPPPVFSQLMKDQNPAMKGEPQMEVVYKNLSEQFVYKIAEEGMIPDHKLKVELLERLKIGIKY